MLFASGVLVYHILPIHYNMSLTIFLFSFLFLCFCSVHDVASFSIGRTKELVVNPGTNAFLSRPATTDSHTLYSTPDDEIKDTENQSSSKEEVLDQIISYIKSPENPSEEAETSLSLDEVTSMIEATFVKACLELASGYVDVLKLFIISVQASYNNGLTLLEILQQLKSYPTQTANRPLLDEEIKLRKIWITCIYLTLDFANWGSEKSEIFTEDGFNKKYVSLVDQITSKQLLSSEGSISSPSSFDIDRFIDESNGAFSSDRTEKAILSHTIRVIFLTLTVLDEVKNCEEEAKGLRGKRLVGGPPRPPIPGTY